MEKRRLGTTDLLTPPVVFGGNVFGWTLNEKESFKMLDEVVEMGFTMIDTADSYSHWAEGNSGGESERIIGKWMKDRGVREKIKLITKVGSNPGREGRDVSKSYILKVAEESLRRLETDYVDLYFTHWDNKSTPVEETLDAYRELINAGKVRYIGASNLSSERLKTSLEAANNTDLPKYEVLQPEYSLVAREKFENGYRGLCQQKGLGVISYFSLASGFLTGKYRKEKDLQGQDREGMVRNYLNETGLRIVNALDKISRDHEVSNAAVALAWILQRPGITAPIASATKSNHLNSFRQAAKLSLSEEEMNRLNELSN